MKQHTLNTCTLAIFAVGSLYVAVWTGACGGSDQRIHERQDAGIKQAADEADLARPIDPKRVEGTAADVTGCLQKRSGAFVLERRDLPVSVGTTGGNAPNVAAASSPDYRLKAKDETLNRFVGKRVEVKGTLSKLETGRADSDNDLAEIEVSSATLVSDACR